MNNKDLSKLIFPKIEPNSSGMLQLDDIHTMYWEESGNKKGIPIVFLHGGPGAGTLPIYRQYFDPHAYRIILYDQRGSGKSIPLGETKNNTTQDLVADIEKLRKQLKIDQWIIFGGSWGSTLALVYAETHPKNCLGLILRGIFLCRKIEIDWFLYGMKYIFPEEWQNFAEHVNESERGNLLESYHKLLNNPDPNVYIPAAIAWSTYEASCISLIKSPDIIKTFQDKVVAIGLAKMESHYFLNNIFLPENSILDNTDKIIDIPSVIVHGRYDIVCPVMNAYDLKAKLPDSTLKIVPDAGHSGFEYGICQELVAATEKFKRELQ